VDFDVSRDELRLRVTMKPEILVQPFVVELEYLESQVGNMYSGRPKV
jgi:hypothetical protein